MMKVLKLSVWWLPFCCYSVDANAWGLITHLYFAHSLVWAMPLLDPRLQAIIKKFPDLIMTGACLPDLAVVNRHFNESHQWHLVQRLLSSAKTEEETALAIGFASHLYVDVIAHNHFVPVHEARWYKAFKSNKPNVQNKESWLKRMHLGKWLNHSALTHISCEWAMDAHIAKLVDTSPTQLLNQHHALIAAFIEPHFHCDSDQTKKAIERLSFWDAVLRRVKLPHVIYQFAKRLDPKLNHHFIYYLAKTQTAMMDFGHTLNGRQPSYAPELKGLDEQALLNWQTECVGHLHLMHPQPIRYFTNINHAPKP